MSTKVLLSCGIASVLLYAAVNVIVPLNFPSYDVASQTISELSAIGAPSATLWSYLCAPYTPLLIAGSIGMLLAAGKSRALKIAALAVFGFAALGFAWPFAPMHTREALAAGGGDLRDTFHIGLGIVSVVLMFTAVIAASRSLGRGFFWYSLFTISVLIVFGILMGRESPGVPIDGPTPYLGIWQRIELGAFNLWVIVVAIMLWKQSARPTSPPAGRHSDRQDRDASAGTAHP